MKDNDSPSKDKLGNDPMEERLLVNPDSCGTKESCYPSASGSAAPGRRKPAKSRRRNGPKFMLEIGFSLIAFFCIANGAIAQRRSSPEGIGYGLFPAGQHRQNAVDSDAGPSRGGPPANDDCSNAQAIALAIDCFAPVPGYNSAATSAGPDASCDDPGANTPDVWYTFTTGAQGNVAITLSRSSGMTDGNYVLYDGACDGNEVACRIAPVPGQQEFLQPATPYWLRVYTNTAYGAPGAFTLCIQDLAAVPAPPNDDCTNVTPSPLAIGGSVTFTGDATYALNSEGLSYNSIWNAFTTSAPADVRVDLCGSTSNLEITWLGLYRSCPADLSNRVLPGSNSYCPNGLGQLCYGHLAAGTYYYAVSNALSPGGYAVHVNAEPAGSSSPANDDCSGALPLSVGAFCSPVNFSPSCASASPPAGGCLDGAANPEDDVWYSFTATQAEMSLGVIPHSTAFGAILEVYAGACGALSSFACANGFDGDPVEVDMNALVPGDVYHVQVYNGYIDTPTDDASYDICLVEGLGLNLGMEERKAARASIYPNPNQGDFTLRMEGNSTAALVTVLDATGRAVWRQRMPASPTGTLAIRAAGMLSAGLYTVRCDDGHRTTTARMIVQ